MWPVYTEDKNQAISEILVEEGRIFVGQINQLQQTAYVFIDEAHSKLLLGLTVLFELPPKNGTRI
jgi:hypothetical protein